MSKVEMLELIHDALQYYDEENIDDSPIVTMSRDGTSDDASLVVTTLKKNRRQNFLISSEAIKQTDEEGNEL